MKDIKIPFDQYDIFGYIIPALIFVMGLLFISLIEPLPIVTKFIIILKTFFETYMIQGSSWFSYTLIAIVLLMFLYSLGHVIASFGSIVIDKIFVENCFGYPYRSLLEMKPCLSSNQNGCIALCIFLIICEILSFTFPKIWLWVVIVYGIFFFVIISMMLHNFAKKEKYLSSLGFILGFCFLNFLKSSIYTTH